MLKRSVISQSGQGWKLAAALIALAFGSVAPLFPVTGTTWTSGTLIALVGYVFGMVYIRCMNCGNRWFWAAAMDAGLYRPLFSESSCPSCGHRFTAK